MTLNLKKFLTDLDYFSFFRVKAGLLIYSKPKEAIAFYPHYTVNLLQNSVVSKRDKSIENELQTTSLLGDSEKTVWHLTYEYGGDNLNNDQLLGVKLVYEQKEILPWKLITSPKEPAGLESPLNSPDFQDYLSKFKKVQSHLLNGDCYQVNLTHLFRFDMKVDFCDYLATFLARKFSIGAYAHGSSIPALHLGILSNSPECLFQYDLKKRQVLSFPIKGTLALNEDNPEQVRQAWRQLQADPKNRAELIMIADLLRNDLSRIQSTFTRASRRFFQLLVPGLIHQYAALSTQLVTAPSLASLLDALFPGGSITGAPKKRVMQIIKAIEEEPRGLYCGSTILLDKSVITASINIRTASFFLKQGVMEYGAGGGITVKSDATEEYNEMLNKLESFFRLFDEGVKESNYGSH